jgi:catechol 2,3-dioxygenase
METSPLNIAMRFSHMGFFVHDLSAMENFYRKVMGFTVTDRGQLTTPAGPMTLVFLSRDPAEHHQIVLVTGRPADLQFNLINQISLRTTDVGSLRKLHEALQKDAGITEIRPVSHGNAISVYFRDPEGNRIEVFVDTPWYCAQPMRVPVDFAMSDEEILADSERIARAAPDFMPREEWVNKMRRRMENGIHA